MISCPNRYVVAARLAAKELKAHAPGISGTAMGRIHLFKRPPLADSRY
jgi:hypothetical protein